MIGDQTNAALRAYGVNGYIDTTPGPRTHPGTGRALMYVDDAWRRVGVVAVIAVAVGWLIGRR